MTKVLNNAIRGSSGSADSIQLHASDQSVTFPGAVTITGALNGSGANLTGISSPLSFRNVLCNGAMRVSQKSTSESGITSSGYHVIDTYRFVDSSIGTWTVSQDSESPTQFSKSYKMDCTTANASPASSSAMRLECRLEGNQLQAFHKGTSDAKPLALSFWTKTNEPGVYTVSLYDHDNNRNVAANYTVSSGEASAQTWVKREVVFPADTTGAWDDDNAKSATLEFIFDAGSGFKSGTQNTSWGATSDAVMAPGMTAALGDDTANVFYLTGIQLEPTSVTDFEYRSYAEDLFRCMRYYQQHVRCGASNAKSTSQVDFNPILYPDMRTAPTISQTGVISMNGDNADKTQGSTGLNVYGSDTTSAFVRLENFSSLTAWRTYLMKFGNTNVLTYSAEL